MNGTCRSFRACGKSAFFSEKTLVVSPSMLKELRDGTCKNISASDRAAVFSHARRVIVPLLGLPFTSHFTKLPDYSAFTRLCFLGIQPQVYDNSHVICSAIETATPSSVLGLASNGITIRQVPEGSLRRHAAPRELLDLLDGFGLHAERVELILIHDSGGKLALPFLEYLSRLVYPSLRFLSRQEESEN